MPALQRRRAGGGGANPDLGRGDLQSRCATRLWQAHHVCIVRRSTTHGCAHSIVHAHATCAAHCTPRTAGFTLQDGAPSGQSWPAAIAAARHMVISRGLRRPGGMLVVCHETVAITILLGSGTGSGPSRPIACCRSGPAAAAPGCSHGARASGWRRQHHSACQWAARCRSWLLLMLLLLQLPSPQQGRRAIYAARRKTAEAGCARHAQWPGQACAIQPGALSL